MVGGQPAKDQKKEAARKVATEGGRKGDMKE